MQYYYSFLNSDIITHIRELKQRRRQRQRGTLKNNGLSYRIQSLHVGMQTTCPLFRRRL